MKNTISLTSICILTAGLIAAPAPAADIGFGVNVNIGNMPSPPVYTPVPVPVPAPVVVETPPVFLAPPSLGVSIAVGVPYDMFMVSSTYYVYKGNQWYNGPRYTGPWRKVSHHRLPPELRRHDIGYYRHVKETEYHAYKRDRDHYPGRYYQAAHDGGGRREEHARRGEQVSWNQGRGESPVRGEGEHHGEGHGRGGGHGH